MLKIDTFSEIGSQHKICQDYSVSSEDPSPFIVLSDGCSSSKDTDMGSRILCHLAKQYFNYNKHSFDYIQKDQLGDWVINNAEQTARHLGLTDTCLDATLIVVYPMLSYLNIVFYGDGLVILEDSKGELEIFSIHYTLNAPYYLSYKINPKRRLDYHNMKVTKKVLETVHGKEIEGEMAYDNPFVLNINLITSGYRKIMICTDGIESFLKGDEKPDKEMLNLIFKQCLSFKTTSGEFLKRRMSRVLKDLKSEGWDHYDDLTAGVILLE